MTTTLAHHNLSPQGTKNVSSTETPKTTLSSLESNAERIMALPIPTKTQVPVGTKVWVRSLDAPWWPARILDIQGPDCPASLVRYKSALQGRVPIFLFGSENCFFSELHMIRLYRRDEQEMFNHANIHDGFKEFAQQPFMKEALAQVDEYLLPMVPAAAAAAAAAAQNTTVNTRKRAIASTLVKKNIPAQRQRRTATPIQSSSSDSSSETEPELEEETSAAGDVKAAHGRALGALPAPIVFKSQRKIDIEENENDTPEEALFKRIMGMRYRLQKTFLCPQVQLTGFDTVRQIFRQLAKLEIPSHILIETKLMKVLRLTLKQHQHTDEAQFPADIKKMFEKAMREFRKQVDESTTT